VCYGGAFGPDLSEVAAFAGLTEAEVVTVHAAATYRVFMMGFVPGFVYLGPLDPRIAAPRRRMPRTRVAAGSVGIAGRQTGVYPTDSPGGWQLIGRTSLATFDVTRPDPFLLSTGDCVQFEPVDAELASRPQRTERPGGDALSPPSGPCLRIIRPGLLTTIQDRGRWGWQARGVPVAGPMDPCSHRVANALVGNDPDAASLEVTLVGPECEFEDERVVAVAGAEFAITLDGRPQASNEPFLVPAGVRLKFGSRRRGARAYLAVAGGIAVPRFLGSRATHLVSRIGGLEGRALAAGDRLPLGGTRGAPRRIAPRGLPSMPAPGDSVRLRVLPGPQLDRFVGTTLETLQSAPYTVGTASDRMGFRLDGPALRHASGADIISDATPHGALQVPASGQPVLLMADRQTTGGYAKVATLISADLGVAGQLAPGDRVVFNACTPAEAVAALMAQERALMALEGAR